MFHNFDQSKAIHIAARGDVLHTRRLTNTYTKRDMYISGVERPSYVSPVKAPVTFKWNISHQNPIEVVPRIEDGTIKIPPVPEPPTETYFFAANHTYSSSESATRLSRLNKKEIAGPAVDEFRRQFPEIEGISVEVYAGAPMIHCKLANLIESVPINIVSAGMNKFASILFLLISASD